MDVRAVQFRKILLLLVMPLYCIAVEPYVPKLADPILEPWRWKHEEVLDGLGVICMDEAPDGSLWFGTTRSVVHYDGIHVTEIPFDDALLSKITNGSGTPWAKAITILKDGCPLILVGESVVLWTGDEWRVIIQDVGSSVFTARMEQADDGTVWLFVPDALWRICDELTQISIVMRASRKSTLKTACLDQAGEPWILEKKGDRFARLVHIPLRNGQPVPVPEWKEFPVPFEDLTANECRIVAGLDGLIWYVDNSGKAGLKAFDLHRGTWVDRKNAAPPRARYSLFQGRDGTFWAGAEGYFLRLPPAGGDVVYSNGQLQLSRVPLSIYETRDGRLWMIERLCDVYSVDVGTNEWMTYEDLTFQYETPDGVQWFLSKTRQHAISHDSRSGVWRQYGLEDGLIDETNLLLGSSHGLIWVAGSHEKRAAIAVFDGEHWTRHCHPEFARWIEPNSGFEAADGTVWFGAGGGQLADVPHSGGALQYRVGENKVTRLLKHHAPPEFPYYVTSLAQTPDNTLWVGSTFLHRYDDTSPVARPVSGLPVANTVDMVVDHEQTLWGAKENFGVFRQRGNSWEMFTEEDGLAGSFLSSLLVLDDGSILASSDKGISRFDGKSWLKHAYPEWFTMSKRWSGLRKSADGSVWLNSVREERRSAQILLSYTNQHHTVRHRPEINSPDTRITGYLQEVSQPGNSHITWTGHDPWSSTPLEELQYAWRLDGGEWSAFSHDTGRTFLGLDSGRHVLEVRARDRAFNIDPVPDRVEFHVIPPIWKQGWFITLVSVLIGLIAVLIAFLIRVRERNLVDQQNVREAFLIKERQEREEFLLRQQEEKEKHLMEMDQLKMGFFTNISHELRTPMTVISGRLETIFEAETDVRRKNALSIILRNAQRVTTLITQLLDFRKIQEGKVKAEATRGDLAPPFRDWVVSLQVLAEQAGLTLSLTCMDRCQGWFDFDKLQKIFTNLIANSIKYTKSGGEIRVMLQEEPDAEEDRRLRFTVEDTGLGISAEHLPHIFERFYRVPEASIAVGAGIGLNLTRELVDILGGEIHVESPIHPDTARPGTRFTVRLPMNQEDFISKRREAAKNNDAPSGELGDLATLREDSLLSDTSCGSDGDAPLLLVVEDDEDIRNFIVEGLESVYRVDGAKNGEAGLQKAKETVPDLIITDLMMPVMDGVTLCRELKTCIETSHIPVVMLTAKTSLDSQMEGLKTGADDYISKPFHMELLRVRIANLLESRRVLREKFCKQMPALSSGVPENTYEKEFLEKVVAVVERNYSEGSFDRDQLASGVNMSLRSLSRKLKAVADRTPSGFIQEYRMVKAAELLAGTTLPITEITFRVGCDDTSHFSRQFKAFFKKSPSAYRSEHQPG